MVPEIQGEGRFATAYIDPDSIAGRPFALSANDGITYYRVRLADLGSTSDKSYLNIAQKLLNFIYAESSLTTQNDIDDFAADLRAANKGKNPQAGQRIEIPYIWIGAVGDAEAEVAREQAPVGVASHLERNLDGEDAALEYAKSLRQPAPYASRTIPTPPTSQQELKDAEDPFVAEDYPADFPDEADETSFASINFKPVRMEDITIEPAGTEEEADQGATGVSYEDFSGLGGRDVSFAPANDWDSRLDFESNYGKDKVRGKLVRNKVGEYAARTANLTSVPPPNHRFDPKEAVLAQRTRNGALITTVPMSTEEIMASATRNKAEIAEREERARLRPLANKSGETVAELNYSNFPIELVPESGVFKVDLPSPNEYITNMRNENISWIQITDLGTGKTTGMSIGTYPEGLTSGYYYFPETTDNASAVAQIDAHENAVAEQQLFIAAADRMEK